MRTHKNSIGMHQHAHDPRGKNSTEKKKERKKHCWLGNSGGDDDFELSVGIFS